jgi:hypothetical protein
MIEEFQKQLLKDRALTAERNRKKKKLTEKTPAVESPIQSDSTDPKDYLKSYLKNKQMALGGGDCGGPGQPPCKGSIQESDLSTKMLRGALPLPNNAAQLIAALANSDSKFSTKDSSRKANEHLYRSVSNAISRTGEANGGTSYDDYNPLVSQDINSLRMADADMVIGSMMSPELEAATTFGRVSYRTDPKTGEVSIYDTYDFNKTQESRGSYSKIRKVAGDASEGSLSPNAKLIGKFTPGQKKSYYDKALDVTQSILNPIDALDIRYSDVKGFTNDLYDTAKGVKKFATDAYNDGKSYIQNNLRPNGKEYALGGQAGGTGFEDKVVNHFGAGGSHEANPLGGIPYGQGKSVEQDEMSYNLKGGKFIFSNKIRYA